MREKREKYSVLSRYQEKRCFELYVGGERWNDLPDRLCADRGDPTGRKNRKPEYPYRGGSDADRLFPVLYAVLF